ncbi:MAG TPA: hypothetical protein VHF89_17335 [Solirubrobacteraceae bacterium]|nr:hypothetical protein [Solirubrobacteraceae bacterium]
MRAVNLIPSDLRRAGGSPGATGQAVYVLLGVLAVAVLMVGAWAVAGRAVANGEADLERVRAEADAAELRAGQLKPYASFHAMRVKRVETVTSLSRSRFNWPFALREVSRVLPSHVWLSSVVGTVAPGVQVEDGSGGATTPLRAQLAAPALEIVGCTTSQEQVARYLARLRSIQGVTRVTLARSEKIDISQQKDAAGRSADGSANDCRQNNARIPQFELIVFFEASTATASVGTAGSASTTPTGATK